MSEFFVGAKSVVDEIDACLNLAVSDATQICNTTVNFINHT